MDVWIIVFLCTAANGLFLSVALFARKGRRSSVLGAFILTFALLLIYYILFWSGLTSDLPRAVNVLFGLTYLLGPLLYWYLTYGQSATLRRHFIPILIYIAYFTAAPLLSRDSLVHTVQVFLQIGHLLAYGLMIFRGAMTDQTPLGRVSAASQRWRRGIAAAFLGYGLSYLAYYLLVWTGLLKLEYDYMISLASSALIYFVGVQGFRNPSVISTESPVKYENSTLTTGARESILQKVKAYFEVEKAFLNSDVSLSSVSEATQIPRHHLSEAINNLEGVNFPEFLTRYRLEEAQKILRDPLESNTKIIEVAYRSGFNNKVSFYQAFRKYLGTSPATYREQHHLALSN